MSSNLKRIIACTVAIGSLVCSVGLASAKFNPSVREPAAPRAKQAATRLACAAPTRLSRLEHSLTRVAQKVLNRQAITIVAIGSSSTFGAGASATDKTYPIRLAVELQALFPDSPVTVLNRGVNGETTADMLARFDRDVFAEHPDLVIWQVGTNSLLQGLPAGPGGVLIRQGLTRLKAEGADMIVVDPQYAPAVLHQNPTAMVDLIALTVRQANVNLFERFAVMRHWKLSQRMPFSAFVTDDDLHMNDWGYGCLAKLMARSISDAVPHPSVAAVAQLRR